jgi:hypothetical protein
VLVRLLVLVVGRKNEGKHININEDIDEDGKGVVEARVAVENHNSSLSRLEG